MSDSHASRPQPAADPADPLAVAQQEYTSFLDGFASVVLGTVDAAGTPLASYAPCVVDERRRITCFVSGMSEHTAAIRQTGRASAMFLEDEGTAKQVFARRRLTYACDAELLERDHEDFDALAAAFKERFGGIAEHIVSMPDFRPARLTPLSGRFVIGFGAAFAIDGDDLDRLTHLGSAGSGHGHASSHGHPGGHGHGHAGGHGHDSAGHREGAPRAAGGTPLADDGSLPPDAEQRIMEHMNTDHADALLRYAHELGGRHDADAAQLLGLDARGLDLAITTEGRRESIRIPFEQPLEKVEDAHATLIHMARWTGPQPGT